MGLSPGIQTRPLIITQTLERIKAMLSEKDRKALEDVHAELKQLDGKVICDMPQLLSRDGFSQLSTKRHIDKLGSLLDADYDEKIKTIDKLGSLLDADYDEKIKTSPRNAENQPKKGKDGKKSEESGS